MAQAAKGVLGAAFNVTHEALAISADLLQLAPIPGLAEAAKTLLTIWDALQMVDVRIPLSAIPIAFMLNAVVLIY